ncbi:hypothetical protein SAMN02746089_00682 [Caldanaerobius fijiensis DSM 17918]|uniref:CobQ/CobB/MinD/ParA nucleotide binding domain-containing protein n=1 Tax=Caldanaerobius fijiensis DSM 17918 TaxID=1121256 RepID=A0A1M4VPE7_9THEO|nr:hypothetical protein [Caldanaerobius fijiensis]SHE70839.1 hypothetical protein SAMN02746089_00682 [Caldanaerobius fijiensis DSM 17918]
MKELYIIVGHYGSGKTEIALNLAIKLLDEGKGPINLVDLDFINPYFRSRNFTEQYKEMGINIISTEEHYRTLDMPALSPRIFGALQDYKPTVFDVGGDDVGALALGYFYNYLSKMNYEMWYVINANRPMTATAEKAYNYLVSIERASRLKVTHLLNNTHLLHETTVQDIKKGNELCRELSKLCGLPIKYTVGKKEILEGIKDVAGEVFYIKNINSHLLMEAIK